MNISEYGKLSDLVDSDDVTELEKALHLGYHNDTALGLLLLDAVENGAKRCFHLLLGHEDAIKLGGPTALGAAARAGDIEAVQALLDANVDLSRPKWQLDADEDHAIRGAMLSMNPEIMEAICSAGGVDRADAGWINEAMEIGATSRKKTSSECLLHFGKALVDRMRRDDAVALESSVLKKITKRMLRKTSPPEMKTIGKELNQRVDSEAALRQEIVKCIAQGRKFEKLFQILGGLTEPKSRQMAEMVVPWVARKAPGSSFTEPGWWALEKLLELEISVDGVDGFGRTALAYVVWRSQDRQDLIDRLIELGANVNATDVGDTGRVRAILDYSYLNKVRGTYSEYLRNLGANTAEELQAEKSES